MYHAHNIVSKDTCWLNRKVRSIANKGSAELRYRLDSFFFHCKLIKVGKNMGNLCTKATGVKEGNQQTFASSQGIKTEGNYKDDKNDNNSVTNIIIEMETNSNMQDIADEDAVSANPEEIMEENADDGEVEMKENVIPAGDKKKKKKKSKTKKKDRAHHGGVKHGVGKHSRPSEGAMNTPLGTLVN